jgi:hypothetical protein
MRSIRVPLELTVSLVDGREWPVKALACRHLQMIIVGMFSTRMGFWLEEVYPMSSGLNVPGCLRCEGIGESSHISTIWFYGASIGASCVLAPRCPLHSHSRLRKLA